MDSNKAYILGLLHDIGRKFGTRHLRHVCDGYAYMLSLGYDEVARICLTHSFNNKTIDEYIGKFDTTEEETEVIRNALEIIPDAAHNSNVDNPDAVNKCIEEFIMTSVLNTQ